jgi:Na+-transporting NADH:ubiquinone oxidoreductase subunit B
MKFLRKQLDSIKPHFSKGGKWEKLHYAFDAFDTFAFSPGTVTESRGVQVRDSIDLKRLMLTVIVSMVPCLLFGIWNVGFQTSLATGQEMSSWEMFQTGLWKVVPLIIVSYASGLTVEFIFASMRKHPVNEGFLVTGMLIPLVMPPDIPLWQVSLATVFAVVIGKEAFGGTGMNILNVALTARAFLYFAYPVNMAGEVWTYIPSGAQKVAGYSGATPLAVAAESATAGVPVTEAFEKFGAGWADNLYTFAGMFTGFIPGSVGETSTLMCLAGRSSWLLPAWAAVRSSSACLPAPTAWACSST